MIKSMVNEKVKILQDEAYYLFDSEKFIKNYQSLDHSFRQYYPKFQIAYSYKTNYTPRVCKIVDELDGYAEVVSDMELELAIKLGVPYKKIIYNGPYKSHSVFKFLISGGICIVDNKEEINQILEFAKKNKEHDFRIGLRLNFDIGNGKISRFGFDIDSCEFKDILGIINSDEYSNVFIDGIHSHHSGVRSLEFWKNRAKIMTTIAKTYFKSPLKFIDLGSGMYGEMEDDLAVQFSQTPLPSFNDYAKIVTQIFNEAFSEEEDDKKPLLIIEPGTTLIANCFMFITKVHSIKDVRGKNFLNIVGSSHNLGMLSTKKNLPIKVINTGTHVPIRMSNACIVGYTCIEADIVYRDFNGKIAVGDIIVFYNVGSYSINMKPPFILPNFSVYEITDEKISEIKKMETLDDLIKTYIA